MNLKLKKAGFTGNSGIDMHFFNKAKKAGKPRLALETPAFQMKLLFGTPNSKIAKKYVKYYLKEANRTIKNFDELVTAWKHGNIARLDSIMVREMKKEQPGLYKEIIVKRNNKWMSEIETLFNNGKTTWVITGALHMIGKNGIVAMLREDGYQVVQL